MPDKILDHYNSIYNLEHAHSICYWDQTTMMPKNSYLARANAMAELEYIIHEKRSSLEILNLIDRELSIYSIPDDKRIALLSAKQEIEIKRLIPGKLMQSIKMASMLCEASWIKNKETNNWDEYYKDLSLVIILMREKASIISEKLNISSYEALLNEHEPGISVRALDSLFSDIQGWLPELISQCDKHIDNKAFENAVSIKTQTKINSTVLKDLGFDFTRGRLDISHHPFCAGNRDDIRITNAFSNNDIISGIYATLHECGHAFYESHLPRKFPGMPCDYPCSVGIHESQSLLFEMFIGKTNYFIKYLTDTLSYYGIKTNEEVIKKHVLKLKPLEMRIKTDELHYLQHIYLRYLVERDIFDKNLNMKEIPDYWNELSTKLLGFNPERFYNRGCMEDIHWSAGFFGYFPCYMLGYVYAAQLFNSLKTHSLKNITSWLNENIWSVGRRMNSIELIESRTNSSISTEYAKLSIIDRYIK